MRFNIETKQLIDGYEKVRKHSQWTQSSHRLFSHSNFMTYFIHFLDVIAFPFSIILEQILFNCPQLLSKVL